jgi:hypothetical protein
MVGGTIDTRGYDWMNGDQMEGFPVAKDFGNPTPDYTELDEQLAKYTYWMHRGRASSFAGVPLYTECRNKTPISGDFTSLRFSLGMTLLENGVYSNEAKGAVREWHDEYAVDDQGHAICSTDTDANRRTHSGWLGLPENVRFRVLKVTNAASGADEVDTKHDLMAGLGDFETDTEVGRWTPTNVAAPDRSTTAPFAGKASLHVGQIQTYDGSAGHAAVTSPTFTVSTSEVTFSFAAKASAVRAVSIAAGAASQEVIVGTAWQRYVVVLPVTAGSQSISLDFGRDNETDLWLDDVHAFAGNADVLRRDFANGSVIVNMTQDTVTVDLGAAAGLRRIVGCEDATVNDGSCVSGMKNIPPRDALILWRSPSGHCP